MTPKVGDTWYRIEQKLYAVALDEYGDTYATRVELLVLKFQVSKVTRCGVRLDNDRTVLDQWTKKYACPTLDLAVESFMARKRRQVSIYNARVNNAEYAMRLAQQLLDKHHATTSIQTS